MTPSDLQIIPGWLAVRPVQVMAMLQSDYRELLRQAKKGKVKRAK